MKTRDNKKIGAKAKQTQIKKYGSEEAYKAEMRRRVKLRKTIGKGGFSDPEVASMAINKRWENEKNKSKEENQSQDEG